MQKEEKSLVLFLFVLAGLSSWTNGAEHWNKEVFLRDKVKKAFRALVEKDLVRERVW